MALNSLVAPLHFLTLQNKTRREWRFSWLAVSLLHPFVVSHWRIRVACYENKQTARSFPKIYSVYSCSCAMKNFKIRLIETEEEFERVIINAMVKEGWGPGPKDAECFLACDPTAAYVGELHGKPVCCATLTK